MNSSNCIEEENEEKSSSKIDFHSLTNSETKNHNNYLNKENVTSNNNSNSNNNNIVQYHKISFTLYAIKSAKFCCF